MRRWTSSGGRPSSSIKRTVKQETTETVTMLLKIKKKMEKGRRTQVVPSRVKSMRVGRGRPFGRRVFGSRNSSKNG